MCFVRPATNVLKDEKSVRHLELLTVLTLFFYLTWTTVRLLYYFSNFQRLYGSLLHSVLEHGNFSNTKISQRSVATYLRRGGIFNKHFTANLLTWHRQLGTVSDGVSAWLNASLMRVNKGHSSHGLR